MDITSPGHEARPVRAPRGTQLNTRGWQQEGALRMLMNNLDAEVAEYPDQLVVYGGTGRAARSWAAFDAMVQQTSRNTEAMLKLAGEVVQPLSNRAALAAEKLKIAA